MTASRPPVHVLVRPLLFLAGFLALFLAGRVALFLLFRENFAHLTGKELAIAFLRGEVYDLSIVLTVAGLGLVMLLVPAAWARGRLWQAVWGWFCYGVFLMFALVFAADLVFFEHHGKHLGAEVTIADHDFGETAQLALTRYWGALAALGVFAMVLFLLWRRHLRRPVWDPRSRAWSVGVFLVAAGLAFVGARGGLGEDRLRIIHAHEGLPAGGGKLVLNGPFKAIHNLAVIGNPDVDYHEWETSLAEVRGLLLAPDDDVPRPDTFPLWRARPARPGPKPNVVVVMLEGWSSSVVDLQRVLMGERSLGLTPRFDALAKKGRLYMRFYACGRRTRNGYASFHAGMPTLPVLPYLGKGMEQMRLSWLGRLADREGYATYWFSGSGAESQGQDRIAAEAGFTTFVTKEDLPGDDLKAWDHDVFAEAARRLAGAREPFLAFVHPSCTHAPYRWPSPEGDRFPPDSRQHRFWNALAYADGSLGGFFDRIREEEWFERTVFVIASDHTQREKREHADPTTEFHVPCLLFGPGVTPGIDDRVGSQTDLIPTIADLAGWSAPHAALGRSLLDDAAGPERGAICTSDELVLRVEASGWVLHNLDRRVTAYGYDAGADFDAIEHRLLSSVQVAFLLWAKNRLVPEASED